MISDKISALKTTSREDIHHHIFFFALILIVFTLPFSIPACSFSIIILFVNWLAENKFQEKYKRLSNNSLALLFMGLYVLHLAGMLYTTDVREGMIELEKKLSILIFPMILASSSSLTAAQFYKIIYAFIIACTVAIFISIYNGIIIYINTGNFFQYSDLSSIVLFHYPYFGMYLVASSLFIAYLVSISTIRVSHKIILLIIAVINISFLFILAARTALISFFILLVANLLHKIFSRKIIILSLLLIAGLAMFAFYAAINMPQLNQRIQDASVSMLIKMASWNCSLEIVRENNLIFGVGTGDSVVKLQECYAKNIEWLTEERVNIALNVHNQFLEIFLSLGSVGLLYFIVCLIKPLQTSLKQNRILYINFIFCFIISITTESMLNAQKGIVFYALFNALFAFHYVDNKNKHQPTIDKKI